MPNLDDLIKETLNTRLESVELPPSRWNELVKQLPTTTSKRWSPLRVSTVAATFFVAACLVISGTVLAKYGVLPGVSTTKWSLPSFFNNSRVTGGSGTYTAPKSLSAVAKAAPYKVWAPTLRDLTLQDVYYDQATPEKRLHIHYVMDNGAVVHVFEATGTFEAAARINDQGTPYSVNGRTWDYILGTFDVGSFYCNLDGSYVQVYFDNPPTQSPFETLLKVVQSGKILN